jgi:hypothetical protein
MRGDFVPARGVSIILEIQARATTMFARTPSIDEIVDRAHGLVLDAIGARLRGFAAAHAI